MNKLLILFISISSCSSLGKVNTLSKDNMDSLIGKKITVIGRAANGHIGAMLIVQDSLRLWIDDLQNWPKGYYFGHDSGKMLKVTGTLIEKYDLPVFIESEEDKIRPRWGMPVPPGTDLKKASHRYLLREAKWEEIK
jgi:hypothetical protein